MTLESLVTWVLFGLVAGTLAGIVMKDGGYGLTWDLVLGVAGSGAATVVVWALGLFSGAGWLGTVGVALIGAMAVLVAQRKGPYARVPAPVRRRTAAKPRR